MFCKKSFPEVYSGPSQTLRRDFLWKKVNGFVWDIDYLRKKGSSIDVWQSPKYATDIDNSSDVKVNIVLDTSFLN